MAEAVPSRRYPWFETVHGTELEQGDIVPGCPVFRPSAAASSADAPVEIIVNRLTGIILTQSCDLVVRADGRCHCKEVLFCPVYSRGELANNEVFARKAAWEEVRKGRWPGYHVLNRCDLPGQEREFMLVDFSEVFTVDVAAVRDIARQQVLRMR